MSRTLSPSQLSLFLEDEEQYYLRYVKKRTKDPQTHQMALGSAFDCYVKKELAGNDFDEAVQKSVEPQNHERAVVDGMDAYLKYVESGAFQILKRELTGANIRCEERQIVEVQGVMLNCIADLYTDDIILDWKVNGYYSSGRPGKGYKRMMKDGVDKADVFSHVDSWKEGCSLIEPSWWIGLETYALVHKAKEVWLDQLIFSNKKLRVAQYRWKFQETGVMDRYRELKERWAKYEATGEFLRDIGRQRILDLL